jgi:magnesium chelatase subunit I
LLPRANRGIFAINELPDLAGKIQVGLFNIMQEGDVQIKGYPIRLPLDLAIVFSANPEDYTARGKIITPLKDRIGSEIRTHYPATVEEGIEITAQEAWIERSGTSDGEAATKQYIPKYINEIIERIAFAARDDKKIDKRSGVSQRLPISAIENVISNAERRALTHQEKLVVPRVSDIYAALPAITGKLELEYEGEMKGADHVSRELIRTAVAKSFDTYLQGVNMTQVVQWFDLGGEIQLGDSAGAEEVLAGLNQIHGLLDKLGKLSVGPKESAEIRVSAAEFVLEGLHAHKKIGRNEERVFTAGEKQPKVQEKPIFDREEPGFGRKRSFN